MKQIEQFYSTFSILPTIGEIRELSLFGSKTVDAIGEVVKIDKNNRIVTLSIMAEGDECETTD